MGKTYRGKDRDWARKAEKRRRQSEKWGGGEAPGSRFRPHRKKTFSERWS